MTVYRSDSLEGKLLKLMMDNGLWLKEAAAVLASVVESEEQKPMQYRWNDPTSDYPDALLAVLWLTIRDAALEWIDENEPQHFARPMFLPPAERDAVLNSNLNKLGAKP